MVDPYGGTSYSSSRVSCVYGYCMGMVMGGNRYGYGYMVCMYDGCVDGYL